jgi:hypothetical protein
MPSSSRCHRLSFSKLAPETTDEVRTGMHASSISNLLSGTGGSGKQADFDPFDSHPRLKKAIHARQNTVENAGPIYRKGVNLEPKSTLLLLFNILEEIVSSGKFI